MKGKQKNKKVVEGLISISDLFCVLYPGAEIEIREEKKAFDFFRVIDNGLNIKFRNIEVTAGNKKLVIGEIQVGLLSLFAIAGIAILVLL